MEILNKNYSIFFIVKIILYGILIELKVTKVFSSSEISIINNLPDNVKPIHYNINIIPNMEEDNFTYNGESYIEIQVKKKSNSIILHAHDLEILEKITIEIKNKTYESVNYVIDDETDFLTIEFQEEIPEGIYILHLKYRGKINDQGQGFYRSNYTDIFGKNQWLISTHLEPHYARNVFPCWDEPAIKATYQISIKHNRKYTALSNTQFKIISSSNDGSNQIWTCFERTPVMSTYLIAFVVGDLDYLSSSEDDSIRVWTRKNSVNRGKSLLEMGIKAFEILENFTGIPYKNHGFKKLDLVAIPKLNSLAVENWGLIFLNEPEVLFHHPMSTMQEENTFEIVAHELSHQWFGNLVTHKCWRYLWLTEGLSTYFSSLINDQVQPSWRIMDTFLVEREAMFNFDSLKSAPILNTETNLYNLFDFAHHKMHYVKSVFIIRMIKYIIGEENFRIGIRNYLKNNKFEAVTPENFNIEMVRVSGNINKTFEKALINWENTPGYPIITITRNYTTNRATVTQSRFFIDRASNSTDRYWIAMNFASEDHPDFDNSSITHWFDPAAISLDLSAPQENKWLICNKQQFGYYRVNYDEKNWKLIINYLKSSNYYKIHYLNRAELIDDAFTFAEFEYLPYSIPFELMEYLEQETDFAPWVVFWKKIERVCKLSLRYSSYYENFKKNILKLFSKLENYTINNQTSHDIFNKNSNKELLLKMTCKFGSTICKNYTLSKVMNWLEDSKKNDLPASIDPVILCSGLLYADENIWSAIFAKYLYNKDSEILKALACTSNYTLLNNLMFVTMNANDHYSRDYLWDLFSSISSKSDMGVKAILDFVEKYETSINVTDPRYEFIRGGVILVRFDIKTENEFKRWSKIIKKIVGEENGLRYINKIKDNIKLYSLQLKSMENYFIKKNNSDVTS